MSTSRAAGTSGTSIYNDGSSGWLSDAQLEYDLSWLTPASRASACVRTRWSGGREFTWMSQTFRSRRSRARIIRAYRASCPFQYWDKKELLFADLRTAVRRFRNHRLQRSAAAAVPGPRSSSSTICTSRICAMFEGWT